MIEDAYPLAALQAGMIYHSELEPDAPTYHDLTTLTLDGRCDRDALEAALAETVRRHPVLRTSFDLTGFSEPVQLVHDSAAVPLEVADLTAAADPDEDLRAWCEAEKRRPFDWTVAPLLRVRVHLLAAERFALSVSFHHAILDGWSVAAFVTELLRRYGARVAGEPLPVQPPGARFRDLVARERELVASPEAAAFWRDRVAEAPSGRLPRLPRDPEPDAAGVQVLATPLDGALRDDLDRVARSLRVPLRTVLLTAHLRVLALLTGDDDVLTGMVVHGRPESEAGDQVLGLFLNTVPVRVSADAGCWSELVRRVFDAEVALLPYRQYPLFEIQRAAGRSPLLDTLFDFRDFHVYGALSADDPVRVVGQDFFEQTDLPLTVAFVREPGAGLALSLSYDSGQFGRAQIEDVRDHYLRALARLAADPESDPRPADAYLAERDATDIERWNTTGRTYPDATLHELVWAQSRRTPEAPAVGFEDTWLSYAELTGRAGRLAALLRRAGAVADRPVGVLMERGLDLPVALLGVLAAGAAYLPLEPDHPPERLRLMLADAGAGLVVTTRDLADRVPAGARTVLVEDLPGETLVAPVPTGSLAYVIFTSGSTGRPKGVGVSHRAIVNRLAWMQETFGLDADDRVLHKTPYGFDVSVWELFWPLITGAGLVVARPGGHMEPAYLTRLITAERVTTLHFVPSMLAAFLQGLEPAERPPFVRRVVCSGEALPPALAAEFGERLPDVELHNLYGPTEAAVDVSWHRCRLGESVVPIGRPVANTRLEVLDARMRRVPVGTPGELCIGGAQLARGYLGRPGLTAERFVPDPYGHGRLYRTGDRARWLPDGEIEYLGRADFQVKVRGMRVELGEIEAVLERHPSVARAVVTARPGDHSLVAYVVPFDVDTDADAQELRRFAGEHLPGYMVPFTVMGLDDLPRTANGKLDRAALPEPSARQRAYAPPRDAVEASLAELWEDLLGVTPVGIHDDFFELGGHSLTALRLAMHVRHRLGRELPVSTVLAAPTLADLAEVLRRPGDLATAHRIVPLNAGGDRTPIVLVHALGGQVFRYQPLARRLGPDQPVHAVAASGLAPGEEPHATMAAMVDDYVRELREVRPHGPYVLGGFCIGGNIALEVARRLRALGEDVPLVVLIYSDADQPVIRSSLEDDTALMFHALADGPPEAGFAMPEGIVDAEERMLAVMSVAADAGRLVPDSKDVEQARRYLAVFRANAHAVGHFRHDPYDGDVALFAPAGQDLGWRAVVKGRLGISVIPDERVPILYEPLVADAAARMRSWMDDGIPAE
ncbi:amino acid adenylation domain-containing protein [Spirillospora sp. CA-294931]|uniref:amino acid adenylation domain-containing protein n=1 Tax=Spirillospora sp. CA-294931 TaxID=3240042 RepID=UPI003D8A47ED